MILSNKLKIGIFLILTAIAVCMITSPVSASTTAGLSWNKSFSGVSVKSVDTDETGSLVVAGLSNGSIMAFDSSGTHKWIISTNASIKKLVEDKSGNVAWININNESGFVTAAGVKTAFRNDSFRNTTDVSISQDGLYYAVAEKSPGKLWVYNSTDGAVYASNQSYYFSNYTLAQLDPVSESYIIAVNESDYKIYKWNVSATGNSWGIMNPYRQYPLSVWDTKMDLFSYRINMSVSGSGAKSFILNTSSALNDQELGNIDINNMSYCLTQSGTYTAVPINRTRIYNSTSYSALAYDLKVKYSNLTSPAEYPYYITAAGDGHPTQPLMLYYNQKYFVINSSSTPNQNTQMVYSSENGINFSCLTNSAGFANKSWLTPAIHMGKMYVCGGYDQEPPYTYYTNCYNSTDGITWTYINNSYPSVLLGGTIPAFWSNGTALFALYGTGGTYVSYNNATNWILLNATNPFGSTGSCNAYFSYYGAFNNRSFIWLSYGGDARTNNMTYYSIDGNIWVNASNLSGTNSNRSPVADTTYMSTTTIMGLVNGGDLTSPYMYQYNSANKTLYRSTDGLNWTGILFGANLPYAMNQSKQLNILLDGSGLYLISRDGVNFAKNVSWVKTNDLQSIRVTIDKNTTSNDTYSLYYGTSGSQQSLNTSITSTNLVSWNWFPVDTQTQKYALIYNTSKSLVGIPQSISIPELGGWVGIGETSNVTHVQINAGGFGTSYSGSSNSGNSNQISTGDGASYSTEGRGLLADIYDISGTRKGTYSTGGQVNSVDISQKTSLYTVAGGDDGKVYIFSKDSSSNWYVYFQGDSGAPITSVSMTYRGEAVLVGRTDGTLEYYLTSVPGATDFTADIFISKGGVGYPLKTVTVETSGDGTIYMSGDSIKTDSSGHASMTATDGRYYRFTVDGVSGVWQATQNYKYYSLNVPIPAYTSPYTYSATLNGTTGIDIRFSDDAPVQTLNITIMDTQTGVVMQNYYDSLITSATHIYTFPPSTSGEYKVVFDFVRQNGVPYKDVKYVVIPGHFGISLGGDNNTKLVIYAIVLLVFMFFALASSAASVKFMVITIPILAALCVWIGLLPLSLTPVIGGMALYAFIRNFKGGGG